MDWVDLSKDRATYGRLVLFSALRDRGHDADHLPAVRCIVASPRECVPKPIISAIPLAAAVRGFRGLAATRYTYAGSALPARLKRSAPLHSINSSARWSGRNVEAERLGSREIDHKLELSRLLDREIAGLHSAQNFIDIVCRAPEPFRIAWSVGYERAGFDKIAGTEKSSAAARQGQRL